MKRHIAIEIISFLFIFLFVYAAVSKLIDIEKFQVQIGQSPLLTAFGWIAWIIPAVEIVVSALMATNKFRLLGLYASFSLMTMFTIYIIAILTLGTFVPCSCGGVLEKLGWTEHLVFNIGFVVLAIAGVLMHEPRPKHATHLTYLFLKL
jgi:hypothetical protein